MGGVQVQIRLCIPILGEKGVHLTPCTPPWIRALKRGHIVNQIKNIILLNWEHFLPQNLRGASPSPKSAREVRRYKRPRPMSALGSELRVPLEILRTSHYLEKFGMHLG